MQPIQDVWRHKEHFFAFMGKLGYLQQLCTKSSEIDSFCLSLIECVPTQSLALAKCEVRFLILSVHNHIFSFHIKFNISYKQYRLKFSQVLFLKAGMNYKICYREILDIPLNDLIAGK